ncbi:Methionyl/Leucyl tRNA synthetase domain-containing protein [Rozella allomycis CSF55]|uniref:methionine--tRNA ligase n=1 Tax=Rozella allomycis (strain CSF55) TaxID=988480 RepID=A0A075AQR7_ROZAC|nr:Methionyl/Leucyl tRNA synthetase domain-containing protein [Rozella allomycis CSF55]|eukprot:EPZ30937.1 Methionyl/Leucyl tRNA synthetase domain-containing protein [Rozella allomycis CSF55]
MRKVLEGEITEMDSLIGRDGDVKSVLSILYFARMSFCEIEDESVKKWMEVARKEYGCVVESLPAKYLKEVKARKVVVSEGIKVERRKDKEILPIEGERNILITSALPYVNNVPHLGNIIGCVLSADVYSRFCRLKGYNSLFICGTDEYGTATETKALEEGISCQELCDRFHKIHSDVYKWFDIDFDSFGRTTTPSQTEIAQDIFLKLNKNGHLQKETVSQLYSESCKMFLADRYVEGTCPLCGYNDARGDQCDSCGKLLNAMELKNPRCKIDGSTPIIKESTHVFIKLNDLQQKCEDFVKESSLKGQWSHNSVSVTNAWFKEGLKPRCITRDLKWGTPVPLEELKEKVFYVWFDAPIGYLSITAEYTKNWEKWWKNPDNVQLYQFMGKDNVPFHTVIFPCSLLGTGDSFTMLHHLSTTEYLNYETGKFSKSRNVGVFGHNVVDSGIPSSIWRYYLLSNRPEQDDSTFLWDDFAAKTNSELLANLGNFVSRTTKFLSAKYNGIVPNATLGDLENKFIEKINEELQVYNQNMEAVKIKAGLKSAMAISALGNLYLTEAKIDNNLFLNHRERCDTVLAFSLNIVYILSSLLYPFIPAACDSILEQLNAPLRFIPTAFSIDLLGGHQIGVPTHLFKKIEEAKIDELKKLYSGSA